jgi:hypothetical protein
MIIMTPSQAAVPSESSSNQVSGLLNHAQYLPVPPPMNLQLPCAGPPWPLRRGPGVLRRAQSWGVGGGCVCLSV